MFLDKLLAGVNYKKIINKKELSFAETSIESVCCDSRKVEKGAIFVCITGALYDGHEYAVAAYENDCRVFVCQHELDLPDDAVLIITDDSRVALAKISATFFSNPSAKLKVIGVTGTKGKTTASLLIYNILNANGIKTGYIGSNGVDFGEFHFSTVNTTPESYDIQHS